MRSKLLKFVREQDLIAAGDTVVCAVSGGADSVALLFSLYLLREKLGITLEAAHFNHNLRGEESQRDEQFVRVLCARYDIPLHVASGQIRPGRKGLEAAARDARYAFLESLPGKIATAHTADDNAETILMHLVRGTGLKGLGGIAPKRGKLIRPMLGITRREVEVFLMEWHLPHVQDSTNGTDAFLRNRLRRHVMPLLAAENPRIAENLSQMALRLRQDEACLGERSGYDTLPEVETLRALPPAVRSRMLERFLKESGVKEPEDVHIAQAEALVFSENPSASAAFPGGVTISRQYGRLTADPPAGEFPPVTLDCPGSIETAGFRITCEPAHNLTQSGSVLTVCPVGKIQIRPRQAGDKIRLSGGTKTLKKLFIDRKIPAAVRGQIPVVCDAAGVLGVYSIGVNLDRAAGNLPAVTIRFDRIQGETENAQGY